MQSKIITTQFGQYETVAFDGINRSGMKPLCDKVVVLCDQASAITKGGIHIPDDIKERTGFAALSGVLVAVGDQAFAYDHARLVKWEGDRPKVGDRVFFQKYSGIEHYGKDGLMYRLMEDRQISAVEIPAE